MRLLVLIFTFAGGICTGQSISRQVIASSGSIGTTGIGSSTTGPSILSTSALADTVLLTQGFQQPHIEGLLSVEFITSQPSCSDYNGGAIELLLQGCTGNYSIEWSTGETGFTIEDLPPGTYSVEIQSGTCFFSGDVVLELNGNCDPYIPNLLTVNGDGANDTWIIPELYFPENAGNKVKIFNRWGQLVWEQEFYNNELNVWDGKNRSGQELPAGTYFYEIVLPDSNKKGYIELLR